MNRPIVFADIETDGLHPGRRAWEIALIRRDLDGTERELSFFLPLNLQNSDPAALTIGRFWDRHPVGRKISGKPPAPGDQAVVYNAHDGAKYVMEWTFGATIVGAVPSFDTEVLARLLRAEGYMPSWHHRLRCVESMTYGALGEDAGGLRDCAEALGIQHSASDLHTALGDARLAKAIHDEILKEDAA
jgi:hypothetical protein